MNCEGGANMTQEYGGAGKVHDMGEDHVPIWFKNESEMCPPLISPARCNKIIYIKISFANSMLFGF